MLNKGFTGVAAAGVGKDSAEIADFGLQEDILWVFYMSRRSAPASVPSAIAKAGGAV
jgi:hypothetical protein